MSSAFVVSTLVGVTVATGLGLAAATLARKRRAASRHVLLMAALGVSLFLPVFAAVMPPVRIAVPITSAVEPVGSAPAEVGASEMNVASTIAEPRGSRRRHRRDLPGRLFPLSPSDCGSPARSWSSRQCGLAFARCGGCAGPRCRGVADRPSPTIVRAP